MQNIERAVKTHREENKTTWLKNGPKVLTDISAKKVNRWQMVVWKDAPSGKCKIKRDITIRLLKWPKSKTLTAQNAREDAEQRELSLIAGGHAKGHSHFRRHLGSFLQNYMYLYHSIQPSCSLGSCQRSSKLMSTQKPAHECLLQLYS